MGLRGLIREPPQVESRLLNASGNLNLSSPLIKLVDQWQLLAHGQPVFRRRAGRSYASRRYKRVLAGCDLEDRPLLPQVVCGRGVIAAMIVAGSQSSNETSARRMACDFQRLFLSCRGPDAVGAAAYNHASLRGAAVDPPGKARGRRSSISFWFTTPRGLSVGFHRHGGGDWLGDTRRTR